MNKKSQNIPNANDVYEKLFLVIDPEMFISIADLGLIYEIHIGSDLKVNEQNNFKIIQQHADKNTDVQKLKENEVYILMTLTTLGCPLFPVIEKEIHEKVRELPWVENVKVEITFEPFWITDYMTEKGRAVLGI